MSFTFIVLSTSWVASVLMFLRSHKSLCVTVVPWTTTIQPTNLVIDCVLERHKVYLTLTAYRAKYRNTWHLCSMARLYPVDIQYNIQLLQCNDQNYICINRTVEAAFLLTHCYQSIHWYDVYSSSYRINSQSKHCLQTLFK